MPNTRDAAVLGQEVSLQVQFIDAGGNEVDADETPEIEIRDFSGDIILASTSDDVFRVDTGLYRFLFTVPSDSDVGSWSDEWNAIIETAPFDATFMFTVVSPAMGLDANTGPGVVRLADDVEFDFSEEEIIGINILLKLLKSRLRSDGKKPSRDQFGKFITDGYGQIVLEDCNVFDDEILICFLCQALSEFNMIPFFTAFNFSDQVIQTLFSAAVVEGAYIFALASQALIEKGRDFTITDGGVSYQPPQLGDFIQGHYSAWLTSYRERLKFIKNSIRPGPVGFGTFSNFASGAPAFTRLRHLRSRRVI
jgi:hypothetical protein